MFVELALRRDPRKNALLKSGNENDRTDARKLSDLLHMNKLSPVYHGEQGMRMLKELARNYITMTRDLNRVDCGCLTTSGSEDRSRT